MCMETKIKLKLPDAEWANWNALVNRGRILAEKRASGVIEMEKEKRTRHYLHKRGRTNVRKVVPDNVKRWILARNAGLSVLRASKATGTTWTEVRMAYMESEECRFAYDAMHEDSRSLMKELAYSTFEDALKGEEVTKHQIKAADRVLSAMETEHFGKPYEKSGVVGADGRIIGGGITIQLVDVSKGYRPPQIAVEGDGDECVLV